MKHKVSFIVVLFMLISLVTSVSAATIYATSYTGFPTFSIESVVPDKSVTIKTANLPPNDTFTVTMGKIGTQGVGGIVVGTTDSGTGGVQTFTYTLPAELVGSAQVAIRMQSPTSGYFAYNWFYNSTVPGTTSPQPTPTATPATPPTSSGYSGFPTFSIESVVPDKSVTIETNNLPANDTFTVTMGKIGTKGAGGLEVASTNSGAGGVQTFTYNIPASLAGMNQIAIRMQSPDSGYFAYNWFFNSSAGATGSPQPSPSATPGPSGYIGFPTFSIGSVVQDKTVTIKTDNLPPNDTFTVTMGKIGTQGINGVEVGTTNSGAGGAQTFTYNIPASLAGLDLVAIRMQSPTSGYFAYNWFVNQTSP